jgi:hypothetical protein
VTLLTGFPFPGGQAQVRTVDLETGQNTPVIGGLSSAIDVLRVGGRRGGLLTLEYSTDQLINAPGRLRLFPAEGGAASDITTNLTTPTSMARDRRGLIYITEISTGRIVRVRLP